MNLTDARCEHFGLWGIQSAYPQGDGSTKKDQHLWSSMCFLNFDGFVNYVYYCSMAIIYNVFLKSWLFVGTCFIMCHLDGC